MATKVINCPCGWTTSSDNDDELVKQAQQHAKEVHNMTPTREEILAMARPG